MALKQEFSGTHSHQHLKEPQNLLFAKPRQPVSFPHLSVGIESGTSSTGPGFLWNNNNNWNKEELKVFDRKTRKHLTIYNALHPRDSVARLYLPRKMGGRGLCSMEDCVELARLGLFNYCVKSREKLLVAARGDECDGLESTTDRRESRRKYAEKNFMGSSLDKQTG